MPLDLLGAGVQAAPRLLVTVNLVFQEETVMRSQLEEIRDQQRQTWDKFSSGWKKWDKVVLDWLDPVGLELVRSAGLRDDANVLDVAAGTGEPGITAAALVPKGMVTVTDLSDDANGYVPSQLAGKVAALRVLAHFGLHVRDVNRFPDATL